MHVQRNKFKFVSKLKVEYCNSNFLLVSKPLEHHSTMISRCLRRTSQHYDVEGLKWGGGLHFVMSNNCAERWNVLSQPM